MYTGPYALIRSTIKSINRIQPYLFWLLAALLLLTPVYGQSQFSLKKESRIEKSAIKGRQPDLNKAASKTASIQDPGMRLLNVGTGKENFRLSEMGGLGISGNARALETSVAYNPTNQQYLVVWQGIDDNTGLENSIYGQFVDALTGEETGPNDFLIASASVYGDSNAVEPSVIYNSAMNEYLVVWRSAIKYTGEITNPYDMHEIFARRIGADGTLLAEDGGPGNAINGIIRVSHLSGVNPGELVSLAGRPQLAWNSDQNQYLVVWAGGLYGDSGLLPGIYAQRLGYTGSTLAELSEDILILQYDDQTPPDYHPHLVYNQAVQEFLLVWHKSGSVWGQRLSPSAESVGANFQINQMPAGGDEARYADVVWNSTDNRYLVVWSGKGSGLANKCDIYGQLLDSAGVSLGGNFAISDMGPANDTRYRAFAPRVAYNSLNNEYLTIWTGDDDTAPLVAGEYEVFGQYLDAAGFEIGPNDFRISKMGSDGSTRYTAQTPAVTFSENRLNSYLVVWSGDDDKQTIDDELEIYGRLLGTEADIAVTVDDGVNEVLAAGMLTYTISLVNNGPDAALKTSISDIFPSELRDISWEASATGGATGYELSGNGNILDHGINMPAGATIHYLVQATVDPAVPDSTLIINVVSVNDSLVFDPDTSNNHDMDDDTRVINRADLAVTLTDGQIWAGVGETVSYSLVLSNNGPVSVSNTTVMSEFPVELYDVSWTATPTGAATGFDSSGTGNLMDTGISLPGGALITYSIMGIVQPETNDSTILVATARTLDSLAIDPDTTNNIATDNDTRVIRRTDLSITNTDQRTMVRAGDTLAYEITVTNLGAIAVDNVTIRDEFPPILHTISWTAAGSAGASGFDSTGQGNIDHSGIHLSAQASIIYSVMSIVDSTAADSAVILNIASVNDDLVFDPDTTNNRAVDNDTRVRHMADLAITNSDQVDVITAGESLLYTIQVKNNGPDPASHVTVADQFPAALLDIIWTATATGGATGYENNGTGHLLDEGIELPVGSMITYSVSALVDTLTNDSTLLINLASVKDRRVFDPDTLNNVALDNDTRVLAYVDTSATGLPGEETTPAGIPRNFALEQNYPNPFNPETDIRFQLPVAGEVRITLYNMRGQEMRILTDQRYDAGYHQVRWNGKDANGIRAASGVYIYRMQTKGFVAHRKLVLMK